MALRTAVNPGSRIVTTHLHTPLLFTSVSLWYVRFCTMFPRLSDVCLHPEIGRGFFEGVCPPSNATAHSCDPPPPCHSRTDFENDALSLLHRQGSMQNRKYATVKHPI